MPTTSKPSIRYRLSNEDRGTLIAGCLGLAGSSATRRSGLRSVPSLDIDEGLVIAPCEAIHTFGMRFPIDVAFLDRSYRIRRVLKNLRPNRFAVCLKAELVVELAAGALGRSGSQLGDRLRFELVRSGGTTSAAAVVKL